MQVDNELASKLTREGEDFERHWSSFMFNMTQVKELKKATTDQIQLLQADSNFTGAGWFTGRASKTLWQLSGCALVKGTISLYRDVWLFSISLMTGVGPPLSGVITTLCGCSFRHGCSS